MFTRKNGDVGAFFSNGAKLLCAAIVKVECHISDTSSYYNGYFSCRDEKLSGIRV